MARIILNVGNCAWCQEGTTEGEKFDPNKRHNCNTCGYYNSYNQELIKYNKRTGIITFSSVRKPQPIKH